MGLAAEIGATLIAQTCIVQDTDGPGVMVATSAAMKLHDSTLSDNQFAAAIAVAEGQLTITNSDISNTQPDPQFGGGFGVFTRAGWAPDGVTLTDNTIGPHPYAAVWLDGEGSYLLENNDLSGSEGIEVGGWPLHGNALFAMGVDAWDGETGLYLSGNTFQDAEEVGVFLHGASATLSDNTWSGNTLDVIQQDCSTITPLTDDELMLQAALGSAFEENAGEALSTDAAFVSRAR